MTELDNRDDYDAELAALMAGILDSQYTDILDLLGDPPDLSKVTAGFWEQETENIIEVLEPFFETAFIARAEQSILELDVELDIDAITNRAANAARRHVFQLAGDIGESSQRLLREAVSSYFEQSMTIGELSDMLVRTFGPVRAEIISVTEVTRAASAGVHEVANQLRELGSQVEEIWHTVSDELVCNICEPLNGKPFERSQEQPAHPRCRCQRSIQITEFETI